jgi:large subunit ribosomal protein L21
MYAIIDSGNKQFCVRAGDTVQVERLATEAGQTVTFDRVLFINNEGKFTHGAPTVANATVMAEVVKHIRGEKKVAFKMKRRKGYHKKIGHRQELSVVKIKEIKI